MTDAQLSALAQAAEPQDFVSKIEKLVIFTCPCCDGSGNGSDQWPEPCRVCSGNGFLTSAQMDAWEIGDC